MKQYYLLTTTLIVLLFSSCSPRIAYLGDYYAPTHDIDLFYDEGDIEKEYKVIGIARNEGDELERDNLEAIRDEMIKKAKTVGADAILFVSVASNNNNSFSNESNKIVESKFLRYK